MDEKQSTAFKTLQIVDLLYEFDNIDNDDYIADDYNDDDDDWGEGIWMKNKAAPHQTDSIDIGGPPSVIHPCNYRPDRDDHDHYDRDDHGFLRLLCFWWSSHLNIGEVPG